MAQIEDGIETVDTHKLILTWDYFITFKYIKFLRGFSNFIVN